MNPKCPKCESLLQSVAINDATGFAVGGKQWRCVIYSCQKCQYPISAQIDPIAIRTDSVKMISEPIDAKIEEEMTSVRHSIALLRQEIQELKRK